MAGAVAVANPNMGLAASATVSASATVATGGGVGTPPEEVTTPVPAPATTPVVDEGVAAGTTIPTPPTNPETNFGAGQVSTVAAAAEAAEQAAEVAAAEAESNEGATNGFGAASRAISLPGFGATASIGVTGAAYQHYSVMLPSGAAYSTGGNIVNLSGFVATTGHTAVMNGVGSGRFGVGAVMESVPLSEVSGQEGTQDTLEGGVVDDAEGFGAAADDSVNRALLAQAFAPRAPFVRIVVTYN